MKKQLGIMLILLATSVIAMAQNERDAFRYAQYSPTGTARYISLSGAMNAFGTDFSALSAGNPGGLGLFKRMEFTLTPSVSYSKISSTYNGENQVGVKYNLTLNNLGAVFTIPIVSSSKWKMVQFATGLNNLARYGGSSIVSGPNDGEADWTTTNYFDYVAESANGIRYNSLSGIAEDAYFCWLINNFSDTDDQYYSPVDDYFNQQQIRESSGYLNEYIFSIGGNYNDQLFIGATIGIPFFNYHQSTTYTESRNSSYDSLIVFDEFSSKATGVNLKLGLIYQPAKYVRLGAAFHTPTRYPNVRETFQNTIDVWGIRVEDTLIYDIGRESDIGKFNYVLTTPYRAMANVAFIYKDRGFINIDYEFSDYSTSHLSSNSYHFLDENKGIKKYYRGTHTVRIGAEFNLSPLALRLGYSYSSNPYDKTTDIDGTRQTISGGIGIKGKIFFADFAYMYRFSKDKDVFYDAMSIRPYTSEIANHVFALTLGCKIGTR